MALDPRGCAPCPPRRAGAGGGAAGVLGPGRAVGPETSGGAGDAARPGGGAPGQAGAGHARSGLTPHVEALLAGLRLPGPADVAPVELRLDPLGSRLGPAPGGRHSPPHRLRGALRRAAGPGASKNERMNDPRERPRQEPRSVKRSGSSWTAITGGHVPARADTIRFVRERFPDDRGLVAVELRLPLVRLLEGSGGGSVKSYEASGRTYARLGLGRREPGPRARRRGLPRTGRA
jgi:hypothetical protein